MLTLSKRETERVRDRERERVRESKRGIRLRDK